MADSVTPTTVGRIITAKRMDAVSIVFPFLPVSCAINGTITNIVLEMGYASGLHREALIATGVVLFVFILLINLSVSMLNRRVHYGD